MRLKAREKPECSNCLFYDGEHCIKDWNVGEDCIYLEVLQKTSPNDYCKDHEYKEEDE